MNLKHVGLAAVAVIALGASATAKGTEANKGLNCPSAANEERIAALEGQMGSLEDRLQALDDRLASLDDARREALDRAKERVETAVHNATGDQEKVDAEVSHALHEALAEGVATARSAQAARQAMQEVRAQMEMLHQQMRALAAHQTDKDADAG